MLYEFHRSQNARRPGCVHASYLLGGIRKPQTSFSTNGANGRDGEDVLMQNSSFLSSSMPEQEEEVEKIAVTTITLAREEDLEGVFVTVLVHDRLMMLQEDRLIRRSRQKSL